MKDYSTKLLFEIFTQVAPPLDLRDETNTGRLIYNVAGGHFEGERIRGKVLPTSGDWVTVHPGSELEFDVRLLLETDDGALVYMSYSGMKTPTEMDRAMFESGKKLDTTNASFRIDPVFETCAPQYAWLNGLQTISLGARDEQGIYSQVFEVN